MQTPASPLKQALVDAGIGKSVYGYFDSSICQPIFSIVAENANQQDKQKFLDTIDTTLKKLVNQGIDKKLIEGAINIWEFTLREADYGYRPKGLAFGLQAMTSWLYEGDPMVFMNFTKDLESIKAALTSNYFEKLIERYFLNNTHSSVAVVIPEKGLETKLEKELIEKLAQIKNKMNQSELDKIAEDENRLEKYHQTPDSKEVLEQIPMLELSDIEKKAQDLPIEVVEKDQYKLFFHPMNTNQIVYISLMFDSTTISQADIPYISLLSTIIGKISTKNYSYEQLSNEISIYTGGIGFASELFTARDNTYYPKFVVSGKALIDKLPKLIDLLSEIILDTLYTEDKRIKDIIREYKTNMLGSLVSSGSVTAARRAVANIFQSNNYDEHISNIAYYEFLSDIEKNLDSNIESVKQKLIETANKLFNKQNLIVSVALDEENKALFEQSFKVLEQRLPNQAIETYQYNFDKQYKKEGFMTASKIQYVAKAVDYKKLGYHFEGSLMVLQTILDLDYLWNTVRVQGGAYGVLISISKNGYIIMASYRDPNIKKTLDAYDNCAGYLSDFNVDEREMRKYIIGTVNSLDATMSNPTKAKVAVIRYITGVTKEQIQKERDEVLGTNCDKIKSYRDMFKEAMKQENIAVIGNENAIKLNKELFEDLNTIFQN
jgi:Zn-dependent M16 (insulinase) family peptidase